ncbi:hypothetical protein OSB04_012503 [Centaurea solstitialis]|uniref:Uncharacterized protein n=1 Tax=Centaurea solstitialis TaxID=347529 RepID=A0AA38TD75_9ASTR|nr:hypothetical protein OSB04_012503 [Centaurea solstitialis]
MEGNFQNIFSDIQQIDTITHFINPVIFYTMSEGQYDGMCHRIQCTTTTHESKWGRFKGEFMGRPIEPVHGRMGLVGTRLDPDTPGSCMNPDSEVLQKSNFILKKKSKLHILQQTTTVNKEPSSFSGLKKCHLKQYAGAALGCASGAAARGLRIRRASVYLTMASSKLSFIALYIVALLGSSSFWLAEGESSNSIASSPYAQPTLVECWLPLEEIESCYLEVYRTFVRQQLGISMGPSCCTLSKKGKFHRIVIKFQPLLSRCSTASQTRWVCLPKATREHTAVFIGFADGKHPLPIEREREREQVATGLGALIRALALCPLPRNGNGLGSRACFASSFPVPTLFPVGFLFEAPSWGFFMPRPRTQPDGKSPIPVPEHDPII